MPRPKALTEIPLVPDIVIRPECFEIGYTGTVTQYGKIPAVGEEYAGREVYVFIRKPKRAQKMRLMGCLTYKNVNKMMMCRYCKYKDASSKPCNEHNVCGIFYKNEIIRIFNET
jgi:recombinational DNA repair protein RecR